VRPTNPSAFRLPHLCSIFPLVLTLPLLSNLAHAWYAFGAAIVGVASGGGQEDRRGEEPEAAAGSIHHGRCRHQSEVDASGEGKIVRQFHVSTWHTYHRYRTERWRRSGGSRRPFSCLRPSTPVPTRTNMGNIQICAMSPGWFVSFPRDSRSRISRNRLDELQLVPHTTVSPSLFLRPQSCKRSRGNNARKKRISWGRGKEAVCVSLPAARHPKFVVEISSIKQPNLPLARRLRPQIIWVLLLYSHAIHVHVQDCQASVFFCLQTQWGNGKCQRG